MDHLRIAARIVEAKKKPRRPVSKKSVPIQVSQHQNMLRPATEYSCRVELSLTADFEGSVGKSQLLRKLKTELLAAIKSGVSTTAREFGIEATNVLLKPIQLDCAVNDYADSEDDEMMPDEADLDSDPDFEEVTKPSRSKSKKKR